MEWLSPAELGLLWVPHNRSLLEAAVSSNDLETVQCAVRAYRQRCPQCLVWQYALPHGLWDTFPNGAQQQICEALAKGLDRVALESPEGQSELDLVAQIEEEGKEQRALRSHFQTVFWYRGDDGWALTSSVSAVPDWDQALVLLASGDVACAADRDAEMLQLLADERVVDVSLWNPLPKAPGRLRWALEAPEAQQRFEAVLDAVLGAACGALAGGAGRERAAPSESLESKSKGPNGARGRVRRSGRAVAGESRFTDGLAAPSQGVQCSFYDQGYRSETGTLAFCLQLPRNPLGLVFELGPVETMCREAVLKACELRRQRVTLSTPHVIAIFVYTYELEYDEVRLPVPVLPALLFVGLSREAARLSVSRLDRRGFQ